MKRLTIKNFGPIKSVEINLKRINLIIGPQSSGKSCVLKIASFCDWVERQIEATQQPMQYCNENVITGNLMKFHRLNGYMHPDSVIRYETGAMEFEYSAKDKRFKFAWHEAKRWKYQRAKVAYIPAERNLVAAIPNWFQISMNQDNILDFMKEWEFARKTFVKEIPILDLPVRYKYSKVSQSDKILLDDGTELELSTTSSGLQSFIPLFVVLKYLTADYFKEKHSSVEQSLWKYNLFAELPKIMPDKSENELSDMVDSIFDTHHTNLFIEEPEAHIFPLTQKSFVYALANMLNGARKHTCFLTTHSPYIMTSFNNLIYANEVASVSKENADRVKERFPKRQWLKLNEVAAFEMKDGEIRSIIDEESGLISAEALDSASGEISDDFDYLLNI